MDRTDTSRIRKRLMSEQSSTPPERPGEIDIASHATLAYSSEDPDHPLEHLIDGHCGRGATRWASARPNATERIVLEFDHPQRISGSSSTTSTQIIRHSSLGRVQIPCSPRAECRVSNPPGHMPARCWSNC
jgi:hypothetical protein